MEDLSDTFKRAIYRNDLAGVRECLRTEDVHAENDLALRLAARYRSAALVELLLEHKADARAAEYDGLCGVSFNARADSARIAELLLQNGASPYAEDGQHVREAASKGLSDVSQVFIAYLLMTPEPQAGLRIKILNEALVRAKPETAALFRIAAMAATAVRNGPPRPC
jgi:hypothetical protein